MDRSEEIKVKLQKAFLIVNPQKRLDELNSCLELCHQRQQELEETKLGSCLNYYNQYQQRKQLEKLTQTVEDCIIDAKLRSLW